MRAAEVGYDTAAEDRLLEASGWEDDGYRLFEVSTPAGSSGRGLFGPMGESSSLFSPGRPGDDLGGLDERFQLPAGGLANHDLYRRACLSCEGAELVVLLGEGTFHQHHGGAATSRRFTWDEMHDDYVAIRGETTAARAPPLYVGRVPAGDLPLRRALGPPGDRPPGRTANQVAVTLTATMPVPGPGGAVTRRTSSCAATASATLMLAGCGDDDGGEDTEEVATPARSRSRRCRSPSQGCRPWPTPTRPRPATRQIEVQPSEQAEMTTGGSRAPAPTSPSTPSLGSRSRLVGRGRRRSGATSRSSSWPRATRRAWRALDAFDPDSGLTHQASAARGRRSATSACGCSTIAGVTLDTRRVEEGCEDEALEQVASGELDAVLLFSGGVTVPDGAEVVEIDEDPTSSFDFSIVLHGPG